MGLQKIPNPFDKNSKLSDLAMQVELIKESLGFVYLIKNNIFRVVLGLLLIFILKVPFQIIALLIGLELLADLVMGFIKIRELKSIANIQTDDNAKSYRKLLILNERWELLKSVANIITNIISVALIFILFFQYISEFVTEHIAPHFPDIIDNFEYIILVLLVFRAFEFIMKIIRYHLIKNLSESDDFAKVNQEFVVIGKTLQLIKAIPIFGVVLLVFFLIGLPIWVVLLIVLFIIVMIIVSLVERKRIKSVKFEKNKIDKTVIQHDIQKIPEEQVAGTVFGIMKVAADFKSAFESFGYSFLGSGKSYLPENTLVFTNYRFLMLQVPVTGGNKIVGERDYVTENFFYNRGEIREKGEDLLKTRPLPQLLEFATNDILYKDIKCVTLKQTKIIIEKNTGKKIAYLFMDREYIDTVRNCLQFYLKDKFIQKN